MTVDQSRRSGLRSSVSGASRGSDLERAACLSYQLQIERGYPLNLSILISGGKENNCDSISNGE